MNRQDFPMRHVSEISCLQHLMNQNLETISEYIKTAVSVQPQMFQYRAPSCLQLNASLRVNLGIATN